MSWTVDNIIEKFEEDEYCDWGDTTKLIAEIRMLREHKRVLRNYVALAATGDTVTSPTLRARFALNSIGESYD